MGVHQPIRCASVCAEYIYPHFQAGSLICKSRV